MTFIPLFTFSVGIATGLGWIRGRGRSGLDDFATCGGFRFRVISGRLRVGVKELVWKSSCYSKASIEALEPKLARSYGCRSDLDDFKARGSMRGSQARRNRAESTCTERKR
ncbi:hypothetical protein BV25DRAFT_1830793 [Artomyces pyxidatus]|uniref:Uncharacterized protein n=1 Tax=Artomyces pyxidatus TaxID=48021 RepID=A0ACB8SN78_9AGAM|nr:hypothetical protein BV25DRAFT_1830793 [Artomyces pyxidatus]